MDAKIGTCSPPRYLCISFSFLNFIPRGSSSVLGPWAVGLAPLMRYSSRMNPGNYEKKATTIMGEGILIRRWTRFKLEILSG